jgi:hypothetical protein
MHTRPKQLFYALDLPLYLAYIYPPLNLSREAREGQFYSIFVLRRIQQFLIIVSLHPSRSAPFIKEPKVVLPLYRLKAKFRIGFSGPLPQEYLLHF